MFKPPAPINTQILFRQAQLLLTMILGSGTLLWLASISGPGKNLTELLAGNNVFLTAAGLILGLWLLTVLPSVSIQRSHSLLLGSAVSVAISLGCWILLSETIPRESLHDILGAPTTGVGWELSARFYGWALLWLAAWLAPALIIRSWPKAAGLIVIATVLSYQIIVSFAATDNVTELLRGQASVMAFASLYLFLCGLSLTSWVVAGRRRLLARLAWLGVGYPVSFACLYWAAEPSVAKYNLEFPALEFILLGGRTGQFTTLQLFLAYFVHYLALVSLLICMRLAARDLLSAKATSTSAPGRVTQFGHRHTLLLLVLVIIVGTLFPFSGWQPPPADALAGAFNRALHHLSAADVITNLLLYLPLGFVIARKTTGQPLHTVLIAGACCAGLSMFLESVQLCLPSRTASPLDVLLNTAGGVSGAIIALRLLAPPRAASDANAHAGPRAQAGAPSYVQMLLAENRGIPWQPVVAASFLLIWTASAISVLAAPQVFSAAGTQQDTPRPDVPKAVLEDFNFRHPRLPHPSIEDVNRLQLDRTYLTRQRAEAKRGHLQAKVLLAYLDPQPTEVSTLIKELLQQSFSDRGNAQVKPIATAYDWLYPHLTKPQRKALLDKLQQGCFYLIGVIERRQLSAYNVFLYNSPLQALMACAIAGYRDAPDGDYVMDYTTHLWREQVLPVWRQVMGKNGGWHEGGEYVAIGIGQAVYQLPNMWRTATGEDFFQEPGIRGFLDFLIYRTRPDGTHMRWGDGAYFAKDAPDRLALAIEYRDHAGYSLGARPPLQPTAWPWGPLTQDSLYDKQALRDKPWFKYFDGLGLVVVRNQGHKDSTYLTFKAGDHFWSHSHLDQGAFTLFKRQPLAIDSGVVGPGYGSEHHLNYSNQTIAHNTLVIRAEENTRLTGKNDKIRHIANDGGQRRVGSGWGRGAPRNLEEWNADHGHFHTGRMLEVQENSGTLVAIGDLTAAYNNAHSDPDNFEDRADRVQSFIRTWIYDRDLDLLLLIDWLHKTKPHYRDKWLLHSIEEPQIDGASIVIETGDNATLYTHVLRPEQIAVNAIGGRDLAFYVDGKNYPIQHFHAKPDNTIQPGEWRVELSQLKQAAESHFVVLLQPRLDLATRDVDVTVNGQELILHTQDVQLSVAIPTSAGKITLNKTTSTQTTEWTVGDPALADQNE